jgi:hypothetical protein
VITKNPKQAATPPPSLAEPDDLKSPSKGRKPKYASEDERKEARREQNKLYRERKRKELEELRRTQAKVAPIDEAEEADE